MQFSLTDMYDASMIVRRIAFIIYANGNVPCHVYYLAVLYMCSVYKL